MISFTENLSATSWTEILNGKGFAAFDCEKSSPVFVYFSESGTPPDISETGNAVRTWPENWDFLASNIIAGKQRIYAKGDNTINGVRG
jgi:hypothetical protein